MSLIGGRIRDLIYVEKEHVNLDEAAAIARVLRCTGKYGAGRPEVRTDEMVTDVLAVMQVLAGPDGDNARYLSRSA
ncbi:hypothetical protein ACWT_5874 [Actinoplanes sp. SE50]|uniref:hypothetical protein n=1 Tax=unclassified Actinoplanes TaxID=2626549 RepID=UPI00023EBDDE|nr:MULTISPECIES: hypothetical protein [unclassified Actinoplanes]AEV86892.1 hypothetical protein ACPL_6005 [Actinoplanes sp. SE50/110]ATO85289.1 hypothetical protein ACWT_5874 [Actinoplanes sp. SE50]SLM02699.1 hypothetical protein ACSP50_5981 [Actinoplanes sp. SE50/110]